MAATALSSRGLALFAGRDGSSGFANVVDVYNSSSGTWAVFTLSTNRFSGRFWIAATSLPNQGLSLFAGGCNYYLGAYSQVDIYNGVQNTWIAASLSTSRCRLAATSLPAQGLALFAGGTANSISAESDVVDVYNSLTQIWSTARLSMKRYDIQATSLPDQGLAIFAGGFTFYMPSQKTGGKTHIDFSLMQFFVTFFGSFHRYYSVQFIFQCC